MEQQLNMTTQTLYPLCFTLAAKHGPAVGVIPVFIPE